MGFLWVGISSSNTYLDCLWPLVHYLKKRGQNACAFTLFQNPLFGNVASSGNQQIFVQT